MLGIRGAQRGRNIIAVRRSHIYGAPGVPDGPISTDRTIGLKLLRIQLELKSLTACRAVDLGLHPASQHGASELKEATVPLADGEECEIRPGAGFGQREQRKLAPRTLEGARALPSIEQRGIVQPAGAFTAHGASPGRSIQTAGSTKVGSVGSTTS
jgi:hypothetical protein